MPGDDEPFRLDDAAVIGPAFPFTFRGVRYVLPPVGSWPIAIMQQIAGGLVEEAMTDLLGEESAERLAADGMTVGHFKALLEQASKA